MSQLSREDMLRELELLPVWQLKKPWLTQPVIDKPTDVVTAPPVLEQVTPVQVAPTDGQAVLVSAQPTVEVVAIQSLMPELIVAPETVQTQTENFEAAASLETTSVEISMPLRLLLSDDGAYAFLIAPYPAKGDHQAVETLFKNMLRAMKVSCRADSTLMPDSLFAECTPKLIISMGEAVANSLLHKTHTLDTWRNQQLQNQIFYETIPLLVTYHPAQLLENAAYKAHAWHDLCLAMKLMQSL